MFRSTVVTWGSGVQWIFVSPENHDQIKTSDHEEKLDSKSLDTSSCRRLWKIKVPTASGLKVFDEGLRHQRAISPRLETHCDPCRSQTTECFCRGCSTGGARSSRRPVCPYALTDCTRLAITVRSVGAAGSLGPWSVGRRRSSGSGPGGWQGCGGLSAAAMSRSPASSSTTLPACDLPASAVASLQCAAATPHGKPEDWGRRREGEGTQSRPGQALDVGERVTRSSGHWALLLVPPTPPNFR